MKKQLFPFVTRTWIILGLVASILAIVGLLFSGFTAFLQVYLYVYQFWLGLSLGCLAVAMLGYLVNSSWGHISRWILEAGAKTLWLMLILFIPIAVGMTRLYPWTDEAVLAADPVLAHKVPYLNIPFFFIRSVLYFSVWIFFAERMSRLAQNPETYFSVERQRVFQRLAAIGIIAYGLTMTFATIDWILSLTPNWYSTIFGLLVILGQALSAFALVLLLLPRLVNYEPIRNRITTTNFRDLGALLLTAVMSWAYLAFSQWLIIWSGNLPHEVTWYLDRSRGGWLWVELLVILAQFILPFFVLLSLRAKRNPRLLAGLSLLILLMRLIDNYWMVVPAFSPGQLSLGWLDFVLPVAMGGFWMAAFTWFFHRTEIYIPSKVRMPEAAHPEQTPSS